MLQLIFNKITKKALFIFFIFFVSFSPAALPPLPPAAPEAPDAPFITPPEPPYSDFEMFFYERMQHETLSSFAKKVANFLMRWQKPARFIPPKEFENDPTCPLNIWVEDILCKITPRVSPIIAIQALILIKKILTLDAETLKRLFATNPIKLDLNKHNTHRLFLIAFIIAFKAIDDRALACKLSCWQIDPFSTLKLKVMEREFLRILNWNIQPSQKKLRTFIERSWPV